MLEAMVLAQQLAFCRDRPISVTASSIVQNKLHTELAICTPDPPGTPFFVLQHKGGAADARMSMNTLRVYYIITSFNNYPFLKGRLVRLTSQGLLYRSSKQKENNTDNAIQ